MRSPPRLLRIALPCGLNFFVTQGISRLRTRRGGNVNRRTSAVAPSTPSQCTSPSLTFIVIESGGKLPPKKTKSPVRFRFRKKTRGAFDCNGLQALETLAAVVEQGGVGAGVFHGNAAAENDAGLRVVGDAAGDVQGGVNRFGQARQSRCAAA